MASGLGAAVLAAAVLAGAASTARPVAAWVAHAPAATRPVVRADRATALAPGARHQRPLASGQTHRYHVQLAANDFLHAVVTPRGIDVVATLIDPAGRDLLTIDLSNDPDSPEPIMIVAPAAGRYLITVRPVNDGVPSGRYTMAIEDRHPAASLDVTRVAAMRKLESAARVNRAPPVAAALRDAIEQAEGARDGFREVHDRLGEASAMVELAKSSYNLTSPDAPSRARDALALCREVGDASRLADALNLAVTADNRAGDIPAAIEHSTQALALAAPTGNRLREANARALLGVAYGRSGDGERAIGQFRRALTLAREVRYQRLVTSLLNNLGLATSHLGAYADALKYYAETLAQARAAGDQRLMALVLANMSTVYRDLDEPRKALACSVEALALARTIGDQDQEARTLNQLGFTYFNLGEFQKALDLHQQSRAVRKHVPFPSSEAAALVGEGQAWLRLGNIDKALDAFTEGLRIRRALGEQYLEAQTLLDLARLERERGRLDVALEHIEASVTLTDSLRGRVVSPDLRASFVAAERKRYDVYIDILMQLDLMQLDAGHPGREFAARALEASERGRARVLLESLLQGRTDIHQGVDPTLLASERAFQRQLDEASTRVSQLTARKAEAPALDAARSAVETLSANYQQIEARIRRESPAYAALTQPHPVTTREIQRDIIDADTLFLEFTLGDQHSWLWVVGPSSIESVQLPPRDRIADAARQIYLLLTARQVRTGESPAAHATRVASADAQWQRASTEFSQMLLGTAATRLGDAWRGKRLLIAPDAALAYVPFAVLPDPAAPTTRLVDGHEIVNVPSASVLAAIRQETGGRAPAAKSLAILADPVFDASDSRVAAHPRAAQTPTMVRSPLEPALTRSAAAPEMASATTRPRAVSLDTELQNGPRLQLARLPFSRREAQAIAALVPADDRLHATDFDANRSVATDGRLGGYRLVHFATHGFVDSEHPELSSLVLSLVRPNGQAQDGFLRLNDIYNMHLPAELVVLSACQTALGKDIRGEGLIGLTRGFMYAGARRIVASLWQVDDVATAELMRVFYRGMLKDGLRPAAALRAAQRELATHPQWKSPYYWSPFVLQGEWK